MGGILGGGMPAAPSPQEAVELSTKTRMIQTRTESTSNTVYSRVSSGHYHLLELELCLHRVNRGVLILYIKHTTLFDHVASAPAIPPF